MTLLFCDNIRAITFNIITLAKLENSTNYFRNFRIFCHFFRFFLALSPWEHVRIINVLIIVLFIWFRCCSYCCSIERCLPLHQSILFRSFSRCDVSRVWLLLFRMCWVFSRIVVPLGSQLCSLRTPNIEQIPNL